MRRDQLLGLIDWPTAMAAPRCSGGHQEVLGAIFGDNAKVIAEWTENGYSGEVIFAYQFKDGHVAIISDSFGSCSGCDSWENTGDDEAKRMIISLVDSCRLFINVFAAYVYCEKEANSAAEEYHYRHAGNLSKQLEPLFADKTK
jgi:hypothetical protein